MRRLRLHVDVTRRITPADIGSGRSHEYFDLLEVEHVTRHQPVVSYTVYEEAIVCAEATQVEHVARRVRRAATFAGLQADARNISQDVTERGHALRFHHLAGNHFDRLRNINQRLRI